MGHILVTGGVGFIGRHLIKKLLQQQQEDCKIIIIDNLTSPNTDDFLSDLDNERYEGKIKFYREDIRNSRAVEEIVRKHEKIDACIHLAAKVSVAESISNPSETVDVNVGGTLSILEACSKHNVENIVFASSAAVYGEPKSLPISEDHTLEPLSPYGASKAAAEALIMSYKNCGKIKNAIILRFFNVYGEEQNPEYAGVITKFAQRLSQGLPPIIYGDGKQTRDFISVNDTINAIMIATSAQVSGTFNIGTGKPISINELAHKMIKASGLDLTPVYHEDNKGDIKQSYADITKSNLLKFAVTDELESSLQQMMKYQIVFTSS